MIGLIYKVQPYQESNRLLFVYTPRGKVSLVAKGSQRLYSELRIISQYLTLIEFEDNNKRMQTLFKASLVDDFQLLKSDYFKAKQAAIMLEAIDKVHDDDLNHEYLFKELINSLSSKNLREASLSFLMKLISNSGFKPNTLADGRKVIGFNLEKSVIVYENETLPISLNVRHLIILIKLIHLTSDKIDELSNEDYEVMEKFIKKYYEYHLRVSLKNIQEDKIDDYS